MLISTYMFIIVSIRNTRTALVMLKLLQSMLTSDGASVYPIHRPTCMRASVKVASLELLKTTASTNLSRCEPFLLYI